jgi:hypothetical protein
MTSSEHNKRVYKKLVLDGGGSFGIAYIGVIKALEHTGLLSEIDTFIGSSVGSILSMLLVLGYTPQEIHGIIVGLDFDKVYSLKSMNMLKSFTYGCRKYISKVIQTAIHNRCGMNDITMLELYEQTKKTLVIHTTCICDNKPVYIDHITHPNISLRKAIDMSISIPFIFPEVEHDGKLYVDGCLCQLPFHLYDKDHLICLFDHQTENTLNKKEKFYFAKQLVQTIGKVDTNHAFYDSLHIVKIPIVGIHSLSNPNESQTNELIRNGFQSIIKFIRE